MNSYKVVFTLKNGMHPLSETVKADSIAQAESIVRQMVKDAGRSIKNIVAIIEV